VWAVLQVGRVGYRWFDMRWAGQTGRGEVIDALCDGKKEEDLLFAYNKW
jgi:hypothetical protein